MITGPSGIITSVQFLIEDNYDFNAYYHTVNDKVQSFNLPYYLKMSKAAIGTVATLAELTDNVPVELLAFTASISNSEVQLLWPTASELNNLGFEIERSIDNQDNFVTVGFVEGKGSSTEINYYSFTDNPQLNGANQLFYHLKQVDFDGSFSWFAESGIVIEKNKNILTLYALLFALLPLLRRRFNETGRGDRVRHFWFQYCKRSL